MFTNVIKENLTEHSKYGKQLRGWPKSFKLASKLRKNWVNFLSHPKALLDNSKDLTPKD